MKQGFTLDNSWGSSGGQFYLTLVGTWDWAEWSRVQLLSNGNSFHEVSGTQFWNCIQRQCLHHSVQNCLWKRSHALSFAVNRFVAELLWLLYASLSIPDLIRSSRGDISQNNLEYQCFSIVIAVLLMNESFCIHVTIYHVCIRDPVKKKLHTHPRPHLNNRRVKAAFFHKPIVTFLHSYATLSLPYLSPLQVVSPAWPSPSVTELWEAVWAANPPALLLRGHLSGNKELYTCVGCPGIS